MDSTDHILVDGSRGEGGGQIVRSSLALSMVTGKPVTIEKIRAGRKKPGLMRQHLTALNAAARISNAYIEGADVGSRSIHFHPGPVQPGVYKFSIGSAGSGTLVLQTILPPLMIADGPSTLTIEGGTHNQWAPPFDFLQRAYLPLVNRMGPRMTAELIRYGFYPAGGGAIAVEVQPSHVLNGFSLLERGEILRREVTALVANLPRHIAEREVDTILRRMKWSTYEGIAREVESNGPGNVVYACLECAALTEVFTGFGRLGAKAEHVAREVVQELREYLKTDAPVGPHLADQLLLPLGISASQPGDHVRGGGFRTSPLTLHSTTHIEILEKFLDIKVDVTEEGDSTVIIVRPA